MAWDATKPEMSQTVANATASTRGNFEALDGLPQVKAALLALAAESAELLALAAESAELDALAAESAELDALAAESAEILDSRIVDHNLDVPSPVNGWYARWENGLQICFGSGSLPGDSWTSTTWGGYYKQGSPIMFAAQFSGTPTVSVGVQDGSIADRGAWLEIVGLTSSQFTPWSLAMGTSTGSVSVYWQAVGRWAA